MKKTLSYFLSLVLVLSMTVGTLALAVPEEGFGIAVRALTIVDSGTCGENLTWKLDDEGTLTVSGIGEMSYQVYYSETEDGKYKKVEQTTNLSSSHTSAVVGCSYYYKVRSIDANGVAGAFSTKYLITVKCAKPTINGTNVKTTGKPRVTWAAVTGAAKYQVYRADTADGKFTKIGAPTLLGQTDNNAVSGKTYFYKVRAVDANGVTGAFSDVISIKCK